MEDIEEIKKKAAKWEKDYKADSMPVAKSERGHPLKVVYTPADVAELDYLADIGFPGEYPFTRGIYPGMYRVRHWAMRLYAGFAFFPKNI